MRIQAAPPSFSGKHYPKSTLVYPESNDVNHADLHPLVEEVLLRNPSEAEVMESADLETLLALMQGILQTMNGGAPLNFSDALRTDQQLYSAVELPSWLKNAQHALSNPHQPMLRLAVVGQIQAGASDAHPFVLDMQLLNPPLPGLQQESCGEFILEHCSGSFSAAHVIYRLSPAAEDLREESDSTPATTERQSGRADKQPALSGSPLFAQFALGWEPDILCIATRLLPAATANAVLARPVYAGDGGYVTTEDYSGSGHQVDISA